MVNVNGSYIQNNKHANNGSQYVPIQPSAVGEVMAQHGLQLASLKTGRAQHVDKIDFQRTLARYRGPEVLPGINLDVIYDSKKLGRGSDNLLLGIYRMICTNGLFVGASYFKMAIVHKGNAIDRLNKGLNNALEQRERLVDTIRSMQGRSLTVSQSNAFALEAMKLVVPDNAIAPIHNLLEVRRQADVGNDAWSVFNVVQENLMQGGNVAYSLESVNEKGEINIRNYTQRRIRGNTARDVEVNQKLFDLAQSVLMAA